MIDLAAGGQANAETTINFNFRNVLWAEMFAIDPVTTGITTLLTFGYKGGKMPINGVMTTIADGTIALSANLTYHIGLTMAGVVTATATTANPLHIPLYTVVTGATTITSMTDMRSAKALEKVSYGITSQALTTANVALTQEQALCDTIVITGALTAQRDIVVPLVRRRWAIRHTGSGFGVRVIGASGTGIVIAIGKAAIVECDGTNVNRLTLDA